MVVALHHPSTLERQGTVEGRGKAIDNAAFDLCLDTVRIYSKAAIDRTHHAVNLDAAVLPDRDVGDQGRIAAERIDD